MTNEWKLTAGCRMIRADCDPIGHISPLPRIAINDPMPVTQESEKTMWEIAADQMKEQRRAARAETIWKLVKQVAEGTNAPTRPADALKSSGGSETAAKSENAPSELPMAVDACWRFDDEWSFTWVRIDPETGKEIA